MKLRVRHGTRVTAASRRLSALAADRHSQSGEDGVRDAIFALIGQKNRVCVEAGAGDGVTGSNTRELVERGWRAVLVEGRDDAFSELHHNCRPFRDALPLYAVVRLEEGGLDAVLPDWVPDDYDFLSLDVDGLDWHLWHAMTRRPRVICVEFNPTFANHVSFVQAADPRVMQGASLLALVELGKDKGYELAATTRINAFFVRAEDFPRLGLDDNRIDSVHDDRLVPIVFEDYKGRLTVVATPNLWGKQC